MLSDDLTNVVHGDKVVDKCHRKLAPRIQLQTICTPSTRDWFIAVHASTSTVQILPFYVSFVHRSSDQFYSTAVVGAASTTTEDSGHEPRSRKRPFSCHVEAVVVGLALAA